VPNKFVLSEPAVWSVIMSQYVDIIALDKLCIFSLVTEVSPLFTSAAAAAKLFSLIFLFYTFD
jgi:hypothetical protein